MGSGRWEPPTPTRYRRRSHHAASCFIGSIELQSAPLSTADSERQWAHTASPPLTPAPLMIAPPFLFSFSFFASRFFSFGAFNVWTTLVLNCSFFLFYCISPKKKKVLLLLAHCTYGPLRCIFSQIHFAQLDPLNWGAKLGTIKRSKLATDKVSYGNIRSTLFWWLWNLSIRFCQLVEWDGKIL